jgi:hypothetical protein
VPTDKPEESSTEEVSSVSVDPSATTQSSDIPSGSQVSVETTAAPETVSSEAAGSVSTDSTELVSRSSSFG